jgi:type VI secretion system protein ImpB
VELQFSSIEDFEPASIVKQVPALKKLFETRNKLRDLMTKADSSQKLESILETVLQNTDNLNRLAGDLATTKEGKKPAKEDKP